jgi:CheY-like chemotaxis protein
MEKRVLIIEDEIDLLESYAEIIESEIEGVKAEKANDGYKGLDLLRENKEKKFDLILLDLMMPGIDGLEVLRVLKEQPEMYVEDHNIIVLTAMVSEKVIQECYELGAKGYLVKAEIEMSDIAQEVKKALEI